MEQLNCHDEQRKGLDSGSALELGLYDQEVFEKIKFPTLKTKTKVSESCDLITMKICVKIVQAGKRILFLHPFL